MPIVSHIMFIILRPTEAPAEFVTEWQDNLKAKAERISKHRQLMIPNEIEFQKRVAGVSHKTWPAFVNPGFVSKGGLGPEAIIAGRKDNLKYAFNKYNRKLNRAFETVDGIPAKRFKESVDDATADFSKGIARRTMPFSGDRIFQGRGPAVLAGLWLTNDAAVEGYLRGGDRLLAGGPFRVCDPHRVPAFRTALNQRIIQAGTNIIKANLQPVAMATENNEMNVLVQSLIDAGLGLDPFATGGLSHCDFALEHSELYLDIQVSVI